MKLNMCSMRTGKKSGKCQSKWAQAPTGLTWWTRSRRYPKMDLSWTLTWTMTRPQQVRSPTLLPTRPVSRHSILNFPTKICTVMCSALLCGDDSSHSQGQSGKRLLLASRGHPIRSVAYQGSCIDPSYLSHTLDPTPDTPRSQTLVAIRLLKKD